MQQVGRQKHQSERGVTKVPLEEVFRGIIPFFLMMMACLALLYVFPQITLALV